MCAAQHPHRCHGLAADAKVARNDVRIRCNVAVLGTKAVGSAFLRPTMVLHAIDFFAGMSHWYNTCYHLYPNEWGKLAWPSKSGVRINSQISAFELHLILTCHYKKSQYSYQHIFEEWVIIHDYREHSYIGTVTNHSSNQMLLLQPILSGLVESSIIGIVVIPFCQYFLVSSAAFCVHPQRSVYDWYISAIDIKNHDFSVVHFSLPHGQEKNITPVESRFHTSTQHHHHLQYKPDPARVS